MKNLYIHLRDRVISIRSLWVVNLKLESQRMKINVVYQIHLPSRSGENVLVSLVPAAFNHFAGVGLVFLFGGVRKESDVVMHVEIEQRTRFPPSLVDYKVVEGIVLRDNEVLLSKKNKKVRKPELFTCCRPTLIYMRLSTFTPRSSGNC